MTPASPHSKTPRRGTCLLLAHLRPVERLTRSEPGPPQARLEGLVGPHLACVLVRGLAGDHRPRPVFDLR